jgi:uncharacterized membrane protein
MTRLGTYWDRRGWDRRGWDGGGRDGRGRSGRGRSGRGMLAGLLVLLSLMYQAPVFAKPHPTARPVVWAALLQQAPAPAAPRSTPDNSGNSFLSRLFSLQSGTEPESDSGMVRVARALVSFALAAFLAACVAYRPRKNLPIFQRNPYVAQTQILLAVVGAALMIVVSDNAARAFGIFAAASLVRFRTNISDPKEITVLLVSLAIGLASGIGRWEIALALTGFIILLLWPLEQFEYTQVVRGMELKIKTHNLTETDAALKRIFKKRNIDAELRKLEAEDEDDPLGVLLYYLNLSPEISLDRLNEEIFAANARHIESIQWHQKKVGSYSYD